MMNELERHLQAVNDELTEDNRVLETDNKALRCGADLVWRWLHNNPPCNDLKRKDMIDILRKMR